MPTSSPNVGRLKVGIMLPVVEGMMAGTTPRWPDILAMATAAERVGLDSVWIIDHLVFPPSEVSDAPIGVWEGWSILAALAATTQRVELGTFVVCTRARPRSWQTSSEASPRRAWISCK